MSQESELRNKIHSTGLVGKMVTATRYYPSRFSEDGKVTGLLLPGVREDGNGNTLPVVYSKNSKSSKTVAIFLEGIEEVSENKKNQEG